jgi:hypothetical protein
MKGEFVVVRVSGGGALVRRVWEDCEDVVLISAPEQFTRLLEGEDALTPIGFPRGDVFRFDPQTEAAIKSGEIDWQQLRPY